MIATDKHIIKHQIIEAHFSSADDEDAVCNALSQSYKQHIGTILDEIFEELFPDNPLIQIDSLEIDLGSLPFEDLGIAFPKAVKASLKDAVFKQIRDRQIRAVYDESDIETRKSPLLYYIRTGRIPWNFDGGLKVLKKAYAGKELPISSEVIQLFGFRESRLRAIHFFEEMVLLTALGSSNAIPKIKKEHLLQFEMFKQVLLKLQKSSGSSAAKTAQRLLLKVRYGTDLYGRIMDHLASPGPIMNQSSVMHLFPSSFNGEVRSLFKLDDLVDTTIFSSEEIEFIKVLLVPKSDASRVQLESPPSAEPGHLTKSGKNVVIESQNEAERASEGLTRETEPKVSFEPGESLVINNAGLVLVWPYLQAFFTGLDLMKDKEFINEVASVKAVHLLHYLVFANTEGDETQWMLNKLLCGLDPDHFVPEKMELSHNEKEESNHLLMALIKNWPAIKSTGPDSLRQTFLQRDGLLIKKDGGWMLKIERRAFDILLDKLTWTISVVKLSWNDYMIHIEW